MSMPRDFTVNGLAFSIHAGLSLLEKPQGREALYRLGATVAREWRRSRTFVFRGDVSRMQEYVNEFLRALRADFPRVIVGNFGGPEVVAEARRMPGGGWDGNLSLFLPKRAGGIFFNHTRVAEMANSSLLGGHKSSRERKMAARHRSYLFMFAVATLHELTHLFVAYLAQGSDDPNSYTPPDVSYLNYVGLVDPETNRSMTGESGRWIEGYLFGGSIEFYRDVSDDNGQAGIPHLLDGQALARKIHPDCILELVTRLQCQYHLRNQSLLRQSRGLLSLGSTEAGSSQQPGAFMRARREQSAPLYNVSINDLNRVPLEPGFILRPRLAAY
ncbi:Stem cell self-renewal Piwi [Fusarium sp. NRRL 25303]|nr:Stem cell self-renewal Piwi [Fusarium sp. NRRL 25303]